MSITVSYYQMTDKYQFCPRFNKDKNIVVRKCLEPCWHINRMFYMEIGKQWNWLEKRDWTNDQWRAYVENSNISTYIVYLKDTPIGYCELELDEEGGVEIVYIALFKNYIGKGIGFHLLSYVVKEAWKMSIDRIWLDTCSMDHINLAKNCLKCGFERYKQEKFDE